MSCAHENNIFLNASGFVVQQQFVDFVVLENCSKKFFQVFTMGTKDYKTFMEISARIESARNFFPIDAFCNLKTRIIPSETQVVHSSNGILYLLMPYHFGSLKNERDKWHYQANQNEKRAKCIIYQIIELMDFCHQVGLFFADFKFDKFVFIDSDKKLLRPLLPLILHCLDKDNKSLLSKISLPFVSPELLNGSSGYCGIATDMWALGVFSFILLSGHYPFIGETPQKLFLNIRQRKVLARSMRQLTATSCIEARIMIWALLCGNVADRPSVERLKQCHWFKMYPEDLTM